MSGLMVVAALSLGVEVGWQPLAGGGFEYIVQIEPHMLESLRAGQEILSEIPPELRGVRRYRLVVGTGPLPRIGTPPAAERPSADGPDRSVPAAATSTSPAGSAAPLGVQPPPTPASSASSVLERVRAARAERGALVSPPLEPSGGGDRSAPAEGSPPPQPPPSGSLMLSPDPRDAASPAASPSAGGAARYGERPRVGPDAGQPHHSSGTAGAPADDPPPAVAAGSSGPAAADAARAAPDPLAPAGRDALAPAGGNPLASNPLVGADPSDRAMPLPAHGPASAVGDRYASPPGAPIDPFAMPAMPSAPRNPPADAAPLPAAGAFPSAPVGDRYAERYAGAPAASPSAGGTSRREADDTAASAAPRVFEPASSPRLASYSAPSAPSGAASTAAAARLASPGLGAPTQPSSAAPSSSDAAPGDAAQDDAAQGDTARGDAGRGDAGRGAALGASWLVALALFASLGGNAYLAWVLWHVRWRYRAVIDRWKLRRKPVLVLRAAGAGSA